MTTPRFVIDTDKEFKKQVKQEAAMIGKTYRRVIIEFLERSVKK